MNIGLFSLEGFVFFMRWFHYIFGVTWIGLLYYFNFVQGSFFNETDATTKSNAIQKLVPRALWWFRYGALFTFLTGTVIYGIRGGQMGGAMMTSAWGIAISVGVLLGLLMFLNVWLIIWPNQKIVIKSATQAAQGGSALPEAAAAGARAVVASRTNTLFSLPMLFFMGAASHLPITVTEGSKEMFWLSVLAIVGLLELNAIKGKVGPMASIAGVIHCSLALWVLLYGLVVLLV